MTKSLFINRLLVYPSEKEIDITFRKGLNIILAEDIGDVNIQTRNSVGKTTFVDLIDFGLGRESFLPDDKKSAKIRMEKMILHLEYSIGSQKYTVLRSLVNEENVILYKDWVIDGLLEGHEFHHNNYDVKKYCSFLENELYEGRNSFDKKKIISWRQSAPILIRDQVGGFQELTKPANYYEKAPVRRKRVEFLLNLLTPEKTDLENRQAEASELAAEKQKAYNVIAKYAKHKQNQSDIEVHSRKISIESEISKKNDVLAHLKDQLVNFNKIKDAENAQRARWFNELRQIKNNILTYHYRIKNYEATINEIQGELEKIDIAQSAVQFLNRYEYKQCPRCLRPFSSDQDENCKHSVNQVSIKSVNLIRTVLNNEKKELIESTLSHQEEIKFLNEQQEELQQMIGVIDASLKKDINVILEQVEDKEGVIANYRKELLELNNSLNLSSDVENYYAEWQEAKQKLTEINKDISTILKEVDKRLLSFQVEVNEVIKFLFSNSRVGLLKRSERKGNFSLEIKHATTDGIDDGAASFPLRVIAFDLALLKLAISEDTNHPKFLIHDSPNVHDIDPKVYRRIFTFVLQLEKEDLEINGKVDFQYFITTIDIPDELKNSEYVRLKLDNSGERGKLFGFTY
ncbi:Uncharacterized protein YydD, contains DUF2326 domain [Paenibacillus uliginis N3/975]|uniref:Uncharacterized protein YydD, contains DUF2326 domain n=1 Tax=Paenibacillus uliginis N3/975 TaxID=1313296 RepID=A0A1X7HPH8_9BACL|nr:DUF2326 domain-containing protein [Paenibacillus uliginis]SMF90476.1 Uncharacterized protein YydD, contains DUF2326 domain [Paenibacillus uliginis N3/975]